MDVAGLGMTGQFERYSLATPGIPPVAIELPALQCLPDVLAALGAAQPVILQAPPGAGKSTALPLALLQSGQIPGRIIMLEPRRLAARNIARFLASQLGEAVGEQVGYRVRGESKISANTRLEIVTEGILTRRLQSDPELDGISLLIFDEFHERNLQADLALALALESRSALRPDLQLLIMSATLDGLDFSDLLPDACLLHSEGRAFPVTALYRPVHRQQPAIPQWGAIIHEALTAQTGSVLVFLPGAGEIERLADWLRERYADQPDLLIAPLHGRLPFSAQQQAIRPAPIGCRKLVLATNVAETSLTIEGIQVVVDTGLERRVRFDVNSGVERLELKQIAKASAIQRAGRAGRLGPGVCYRLWSQEQQDRLDEQSPPDIRVVELSGLLLESLLWGAEPERLPLLELPPAANLLAARRLLSALQALDAQGQLTAQGKLLGRLPCHPRLAHMLLCAVELESAGRAGLVESACYLIALIEEDKRGADSLTSLLRRHEAALRPAAHQWRSRLQRLLPKAEFHWQRPALESLGLLAAMAWPDRIARLRSSSRYQFSGGAECRSRA